MGTPAYMAPEQARDASNVDFRADQYSLGCTLYYLCAGKPPYSGSSAMEIITQHLQAPAPSLEGQVRSLPGGLNKILTRMVAKAPEERYENLGEAIADIETVLGVESEKGPFTPREQHLRALEQSQTAYYSASMARVQKALVTVFFGLCICLLMIEAVLRIHYAAAMLLGIVLLTPAINFIVGGLLNRTYLFRRVRSVFFGMTIMGWVKTGAGVLVGLGLIYALGLLPYWLAAAILSTIFVAAFQTRVVRELKRQRASALEEAGAMLKQLRLRGLSEDAVQDFFCRFSGDQWEEMFEDLFGYEDMVLARGKWAAAERVNPRKRYATWRDPIARWLQTVETERKNARERRQLAKVEAKRLKAYGASEKEAQRKGEKLAARAHADIKIATQIAQAGSYVFRIHTIEKHVWDLALQFLRLVAGTALIVYFAAHTLHSRVPHSLAPFIDKLLALRLPGPLRAAAITSAGAAVGLALIISAFSWRRIATSLVLLGAALVIGGGYLLPQVSSRISTLHVDTATYYLASLGIAGFGLLLSIHAKLAGKHF
jgi:hypothetical protein